MGKTRGRYKPKEENVIKLISFLSKEKQKQAKEVIQVDRDDIHK